MFYVPSMEELGKSSINHSYCTYHILEAPVKNPVGKRIASLQRVTAWQIVYMEKTAKGEAYHQLGLLLFSETCKYETWLVYVPYPWESPETSANKSCQTPESIEAKQRIKREEELLPSPSPSLPSPFENIQHKKLVYMPSHWENWQEKRKRKQKPLQTKIQWTSTPPKQIHLTINEAFIVAALTTSSSPYFSRKQPVRPCQWHPSTFDMPSIVAMNFERPPRRKKSHVSRARNRKEFCV